MIADASTEDALVQVGCEFGGGFGDLATMETPTCQANGRCEGCPVGYIGNTCQFPVSCFTMKAYDDYFDGGSLADGCFNGGVCNNETSFCDCPAGYDGTLCQFPGAFQYQEAWEWLLS